MFGRHVRPLSVLLVDDNLDALEALADYLRTANIAVVKSTNAAEAIKVATQLLPDVIVLDVDMPGRDGYWMVDALQNDGATAPIPVVFFTARDQRLSPFNPHVQGFVQKSANPQQLLSVVRRVGDARRAKLAN
jgi:CheY-like chemotaxis protein